MKIKGFTLAEVLIVLMVLGVIATLTLPALNANIQKQQVGPALLRAISTLDTANALVAQEQDFYNFSESCEDYLTDCFEPFVKEKIGAARLDETMVYGRFDNPSRPAMTLGDSVPGYITKNGIIYYISNALPASHSGSSYINNTNVWHIYIDVNGKKRPNVFAKDLFYVVLVPEDEGCKVYAVGSKALKEYANTYWGGSDQSIFANSWDTPPTSGGGSTCNENAVSGSPIGFYCAGSVVDNGGKIIYKWN